MRDFYSELMDERLSKEKYPDENAYERNATWEMATGEEDKMIRRLTVSENRFLFELAINKSTPSEKRRRTIVNS